ncbi:hypothetical protein X777_13162, partial [Ooceraea biroi]
DIVYLYRFCNGNINAAHCEYATRFLNRRLPNRILLSLTFHRLRETGSFNMVPRADEVFEPLQNKRIIAIILQHFNQNPSTNIRKSVSELGISFTIIFGDKSLSVKQHHKQQREESATTPRQVARDLYLDRGLQANGQDSARKCSETVYRPLRDSIVDRLRYAPLIPGIGDRGFTRDVRDTQDVKMKFQMLLVVLVVTAQALLADTGTRTAVEGPCGDAFHISTVPIGDKTGIARCMSRIIIEQDNTPLTMSYISRTRRQETGD